MPYYPAAWSSESWKPIGGCCFTGVPSALTGNSAFRFCLLLQWHAIAIPPTALFPGARIEEDTDVESARTLSEPDQDFLARSLLAAATDQNSRESGSSLPKRLLAEEQSCPMRGQRPRDPQLATPALFVPWQEVAKQLDIPVVHEDLSEDLRTMSQTAIGILPTEHQRDFHQLQGIAFSQIPQGRVPVETVAPIVLDSMYETHPWVPYWESMLWHMAQSYRFWLAAPESPPPSRIQINCGGLGGGALDSPTTPAFHCTHPRVNGTCVYGPSLAPADRTVGRSRRLLRVIRLVSLHERYFWLRANSCRSTDSLPYQRTAGAQFALTHAVALQKKKGR